MLTRSGSDRTLQSTVGLRGTAFHHPCDPRLPGTLGMLSEYLRIPEKRRPVSAKCAAQTVMIGAGLARLQWAVSNHLGGRKEDALLGLGGL